MDTIKYEVDGEPQQTTDRVLTASVILVNAKLDPSTHYLIQIEGQHQESYKDHPNQQIHMHENMKFISIYTGPTPVS